MDFKLHCCNETTNERAIFYYNNEDNTLLDSKGNFIIKKSNNFASKELPIISPDNPGKKDKDNIRIIKIQLGLGCNTKCKYCRQSECSTSNYTHGSIEIDRFVDSLPSVSGGGESVFQFWGGEPLLYWDTLKSLAEEIRHRYPEATLYTLTNGSLLDYEKNEWLDHMGFVVGVSHDGPGQYNRGNDPLFNIKQREVVFDLFNRLNNKVRFSFCPTITKDNSDRQVINDWFRREIGHSYFCLGEGNFMHATAEEHVSSCLVTPGEMHSYSLLYLTELRNEAMKNMLMGPINMGIMRDSLQYHRSWDSLRTACSCDKEEVIDVTLRGEVIVCHNFPADHISSNGEPMRVGFLDKLDEVCVNTTIPWYTIEECKNCPVLHMCAGDCPLTPFNLRTCNCNNSFSDRIPYLAVAIEQITGYLPYFIEGSCAEEQKDIFGVAETGDYFKLFFNPTK